MTRPLLRLLVLLFALSLAGVSAAQTPFTITKKRRLQPLCPVDTALEFVAPMPTEEVPVFHGAPGSMPESWHVILEISLEQPAHPAIQTGVFEGQYLPSPGSTAVMPTDVNGDTLLGDPHPAIPDLTLVMDDGLLFNGFFLPGGTNLSSFFELIGSEVELGRDQTTLVTWIVDPQFMIVDADANLMSTLTATINGVTDQVTVRHGWDPRYQPCSSGQTPTVSIFTSDWHSTVDSMVMPEPETAWLVGVEVRIPCIFDTSTVPPTPLPLDPLVGPAPGVMPMTGNFPMVPGPGFHPSYPSLWVAFGDDYMDVATGSFVPGGTVSGGQCPVIYGTTGANLAFAFEQASVSAWYGLDRVMNTADDQLIYRFTMLADGHILDSDALMMETLITASIETECNHFSTTNVRIAHDPMVVTPDPQ